MPFSCDTLNKRLDATCAWIHKHIHRHTHTPLSWWQTRTQRLILNIRETECWRANVTSSSLYSNYSALETQEETQGLWSIKEGRFEDAESRWRSSRSTVKGEEGRGRVESRRRKRRRQRKADYRRSRGEVEKVGDDLGGEAAYKINTIVLLFIGLTWWDRDAGQFPRTICYMKTQLYTTAIDGEPRSSLFLWMTPYLLGCLN